MRIFSEIKYLGATFLSKIYKTRDEEICSILN